MKQQIVRVSPVQTAKVLAVLYFVMSLPFIVLMFVPMTMGAEQSMSVWWIISLPFMYALFGFIFSVVGAWFYNLVAARVGGIEFTTRPADNAG